jgi:hypothetical protein
VLAAPLCGPLLFLLRTPTAPIHSSSFERSHASNQDKEQCQQTTALHWPTMKRIRREWRDFVRYRHAYALAASASLGSIFYGWDIGLIGGILSMASFESYFGLDKKSKADRANLSGNIVSVLQAGCL